MSTTTSRTARSGALITSLALGALLLLGTAISAIPRIAGYFTGHWTGYGDLITGREPSIQISDAVPAPSEVDGVDYSGVVIVSDQSLVMPRLLQASAEGLGILVILAGGALAIMLALRMLRGRPFARMLSWGLGAMGVLTVITGSVAPQLNAGAVDVAVRELGYAVYDSSPDGMLTPNGPEAIALPLWDPLWVIDRMDVTLLLLGVIISVVGLLVADGVRLQRDAEGLI